MAVWIVAYDRAAKSWTSGGELSSYSRSHYDIYQVEAMFRSAAEATARVRRKRQANLTGPQRHVLGALLECALADSASVSLTAGIQIDDDELRTAKALQSKGLLIMNGDFEASLTFDALNFVATLAPNYDPVPAAEKTIPAVR